MDDQYQFAIAALVGAALSALRAEGLDWWLRGIVLFSGYGAGQYLGPWVAEKLHLQGVGLVGFGFLAGLMGNDALGLLTEYCHRNMVLRLLSLLRAEEKE